MPLNITRKLRLPASEYYSHRYPKSLCVLHHSVGGSARSTFTWWHTDRNHSGLPTRIGTAYIVERDGTIFEIFPPECWAYHLGIKGAHGRVDHRSIGIEMANEGPLIHRGGKFYCFGHVSERTEYDGKVFDYKWEYRQQYRYFAAYTDKQIKATVRLVDHLIFRFHIPAVMPRNPFKANQAKYLNYKGILGHAHLRPDKTDPHPGFPWDELACRCGLKRTP